MKQVTLIVLVLFSIGIANIYAQKFENESEFYPKTVFIAQIYPHRLGYRIDYYKQDNSIGTLWAPTRWFQDAAGVGEINYGKRGAYPYVTFFYKDGEVDHFRLYLVQNLHHPSWGRLPAQGDDAEKFPSPDSKPQVSF